jgi:vitamin-K-epoxide reductase (warfarin-sensitive)
MIDEISIIVILCIAGFFLSVYALYVERKHAKNQRYKAVCDINEKASCTKAFASKYGKTFGMPNSAYGMVFYAAIFILLFLGFYDYVFYLAILAMMGSVRLAYVLYFKLKDMCIVCTSIYVVNILILVVGYLLVY